MGAERSDVTIFSVNVVVLEGKIIACLRVCCVIYIEMYETMSGLCCDEQTSVPHQKALICRTFYIYIYVCLS